MTCLFDWFKDLADCAIYVIVVIAMIGGFVGAGVALSIGFRLWVGGLAPISHSLLMVVIAAFFWAVGYGCIEIEDRLAELID